MINGMPQSGIGRQALEQELEALRATDRDRTLERFVTLTPSGDAGQMKKNPPNYHRHRFPPAIISHAVSLYYRFTLSLRNIEDLLAERRVIVSYESIRRWCKKFGPAYARRIKKRLGPRSDVWHMDEVVINIQGHQYYLWRAVDQDGDTLDILIQQRKNKKAALRFLRKLLKGQGSSPLRIVTDKLPSYGAAKKELMRSVVHFQDRYANNRCEVSHEHTREQERQMRRFRSAGDAHRFLSVHGQVHNLFRVGRHLLRAHNYRLLRTRAFATWQEVTCVC